MFRIFLMFSFLILCTQASAKIIQYEFDITSAWFSLGSMYEYDDWDAGRFGSSIRHDNPLYEEIVSAIHPLGHLKGQTGRVSLQLQGAEYVDSVNCLSGLLCVDFNQMNGSTHPSSFSLSGFTIYAWSAVPSGEWYMILNDLEAGTGRISFTDDQLSGFGWFDGTKYSHSGAVASFTFDNFSATEVVAAPAPVPLPATAWLLGLGLLTIGCRAKQSRQAFKA